MNEEREAYERFMRKQLVGIRRPVAALGSGALRPPELDRVRLLRLEGSESGAEHIDNAELRAVMRRQFG